MSPLAQTRQQPLRPQHPHASLPAARSSQLVAVAAAAQQVCRHVLAERAEITGADGVDGALQLLARRSRVGSEPGDADDAAPQLRNERTGGEQKETHPPRRREEKRRLPDIRSGESDAGTTVDACVEPRAGANDRRGVVKRLCDAVALRCGERGSDDVSEASRGVEGETGLERVEKGENRSAHRLHRTLQKRLLLTRGEEEDTNTQVEVGEEEDVHVLGKRTDGNVPRARGTRRRH